MQVEFWDFKCLSHFFYMFQGFQKYPYYRWCTEGFILPFWGIDDSCKDEGEENHFTTAASTRRSIFSKVQIWFNPSDNAGPAFSFSERLIGESSLQYYSRSICNSLEMSWGHGGSRSERNNVCFVRRINAGEQRSLKYALRSKRTFRNFKNISGISH